MVYLAFLQCYSSNTGPVIKLKSYLKDLNHFLKVGIWKSDLSDKGIVKRYAYQFLKVGILSYKHFQDDKLQLRASALTFFTLLSIVPVLALAFGLAKGFGLDKELEIQLLEKFSGQEEVLAQSLEFARTLLDSTRGGLIAGIGLVFLFYSVMKLLNNIEDSFNGIWYVRKQRTITRKITDYLSIMLIGPILIILANSLTIFITSEIASLTETVTLIGLFKGIIFPLLRLLPYMVVWILFTLIYMIMPNTTVRFKSAMIAGVIAGSTFQIVQWGIIYFGVNVSRYNAIYGSFAALPLFLIWLQLSWLIVLIGAEISYAIQHASNYESPDVDEFSIAAKKNLALSISLLIIKNFKNGGHPMTADQINIHFEAPDKLLREVITALMACMILSETKTADDTSAYQPAQDTDRLDVCSILKSYENIGVPVNDLKTNEYIILITEIVDKMNFTLIKSKENKLLKEL